jgi:hypothetical protein
MMPEPNSSNSRLAAALRLASQGVYVFPVHGIDTAGRCTCGRAPVNGRKGSRCTPGKHPRTRDGYKEATTDRAQIERWWTRWPDANIGIALERSGLVDVAPDSPEWLAKFERLGLPTFAYYQSPGGDGHRHYLFRRPEGCPTTRICRSGEYDVLSAGCAIAPPSTGENGRAYAWMMGEPDLVDGLPAPPDWVVQMLVSHVAPNVRRARAAPEHTVRPSDAVRSAPAPSGPPCPLDQRGMAVWEGHVVCTKPDGTIDRSRSHWQLAAVLLNAGASAEAVVDALRERDETLGWTKYAGHRRRDKEYERIVDKLVAEIGRGAPAGEAGDGDRARAGCIPAQASGPDADRAAQYYTMYFTLQRLCSLQARVRMNLALGAALANAGIVIVHEWQSARERGLVGPEGGVPIYRTDVARKVPCSPCSVSDYYGKLERAGWLRRYHRLVWDEVGRKPKSITFIALVHDTIEANLEALATLELERGHGGKRCPACGSTRLVIVCEDCGTTSGGLGDG